MKNNIPQGSDFEQFMRESLQQHNDAPDNNTWDNIAARQRGHNRWLRFRHFAPRLLPVIVAAGIAVAGWKHFSGDASALPGVPGTPATAPQQQTAPMLQAEATEIPSLANPATTSRAPHATPARPRAAHLQSSVPATVVRFDASEGLRYQSPATGTAVDIPANALVHADGRPVIGEVEFELREYRDIGDFLASGIPMHYADERGDYFFNSGGMFDLRVYQRGEALQLADGKDCGVQFKSTHKLTQPSLYYFDENQNAWTYQSNPAMSASPQAPVVTENTVVRDNRGLQLACLPSETIGKVEAWAQPEDNEAAARLQTAVQTGYDYAFGKITMPGWFRKHPYWTNEQLLTGLEQSLIRLKRHKDTDDMFFPEDVNNVFTELKAFKDCYFIINNGLGSKKSFTTKDFNDYFDRVSIVQENGATCYISFFGKQGLLQFYATLIGSTENKNFDAEKVLAEYSFLRNQRQQNFEKQANAWRHFLFTAQIFQEPQEWCMDAYSWFEYFDANLPLMRQRYGKLHTQGVSTDKALAMSTWKTWSKRVREIMLDNFSNKRSADRKMKKEDGLEYALTVSNFGLFNCDQIYRLADRGQEKPVFLTATYRNAEGQRIVAKSVSIMEKNSRLFFTLPKASEMVYSPARNFDIIVLDDKGRYHHLPAERYRKQVPDHRVFAMTLEDVTDKVRTPRDWLEVLAL